ncbi:SCO family protein [Flagellimonas meridianipacifica]|uniref:Protein SCO1/2 n=1 Tax=Flagellimonas meridianipacifica TaxID=1080225 RepID=A0A2T0MJ47_9FLAO|nr:SCO family protein [Allomuricauda pacifica]PRX57607.1 protein SCO1/2 [Allomuricauda pacifica]
MKTLKPILLFLFLVLAGCQNYESKEIGMLPILGETSVHPVTGETIYYQAPEFTLTSQYANLYSSDELEGKIHVVDFFFTSCPSICPKMTRHLQEVQNHFKNDHRIQILSYSIDGMNDTPEVLNAYSNSYEVDGNQWKLLTGEPGEVFELSKGYKVMAYDDDFMGQRNLVHDGTFVLLDDKRRIRGYYNGLELEDTQRMISDMELLLKTM